MTLPTVFSRHRRSVSRIATGVAAAAALAIVMTACAGAEDAATSSDSASFGDASIQLGWIKNTEFAGEFMAEANGHFSDAGFTSVDLVEGPANVEGAVLAGNALMGIGNAISTGAVVANEGAPLKIIGATYQKNPFTILSLADNGNIATLDDLAGKTIGVQASNLNLWEAFLAVNDIDESTLTTLPVQYDPTPLFNGEVDGWFSYLTNESLDAELQGLSPVNLPLADFGLPFVAETFTVTDDAIANNREALKALLVAEIKGWSDAMNDQAAAVDYAIATYGDAFGLTVEKETLQMSLQSKDLIVSDETVANGLFTISDSLQAQSVATLAAAGFTVTAGQLFDMSLLAEVYEENPELIAYAK